MRTRGLLPQALSVGLILAVTLVPATGRNTLELSPLADFRRALAHPSDSSDVLEVLGNVALFLPFGATLALQRWSLRRALLVALAFSAAIECVQLFIPGRTTSVDDAICNTVGAGIGWFLVGRGRFEFSVQTTRIARRLAWAFGGRGR